MLNTHRYGSKKYDANGNEIGTLTKDGLSDTVSTKASPLEAVAGQTEQYSILPPKKASSMVLSDGTNTTERLAIKPGTVYTVSGVTVHTAVQPESSAKIQSITDMNGRTDKDYIYFTDKDHLIRGSVETDTVYAYYFGGEYGEFTGLTNGVEPVRTYKDSQNNIVYVYQPPLNSTISTNDYPKVIFTNGAENSANRKMTEAITYELGKGYTPDVDSTRPYGPDTDAYQVDTRIVGTSDDVYTRTSNTRQFTFIMNGTEYSHQLYLWDNLHIIFYGADGISKTGNTDGYVLFEDDNDHRNQPFVIDADPENPVEVKLALKDDESKYVPNDTGHAQPTTDENGILIVGELEWGNYYFEEVSVPVNSGYKATVTDIDGNEQKNRVYFSVGRNNCEIMQQLICKEEAEKAKLRITKIINDRMDVWGNPTFIFKIKQTQIIRFSATAKKSKSPMKRNSIS